MALPEGAVDSSVNKARLAPLLFAGALTLPASFAGYMTLGFCGLAWQCLADDALILAVPCVLLSIWFKRVGPALLWIVFVITLSRLLPRELHSTALMVINIMLLVAALLVQFATTIAVYLVGAEDQSRHESV